MITAKTEDTSNVEGLCEAILLKTNEMGLRYIMASILIAMRKKGGTNDG